MSHPLFISPPSFPLSHVNIFSYIFDIWNIFSCVPFTYQLFFGSFCPIHDFRRSIVPWQWVLLSKIFPFITSLMTVLTMTNHPAMSFLTLFASPTITPSTTLNCLFGQFCSRKTLTSSPTLWLVATTYLKTTIPPNRLINCLFAKCCSSTVQRLLRLTMMKLWLPHGTSWNAVLFPVTTVLPNKYWLLTCWKNTTCGSGHTVNHKAQTDGSFIVQFANNFVCHSFVSVTATQTSFFTSSSTKTIQDTNNTPQLNAIALLCNVRIWSHLAGCGQMAVLSQCMVQLFSTTQKYDHWLTNSTFTAFPP